MFALRNIGTDEAVLAICEGMSFCKSDIIHFRIKFLKTVKNKYVINVCYM
jgi:hypothetical protein